MPNDFPDLKLMQQKLNEFDFVKYEPISKHRIESMEKWLELELIQLASQLLKTDITNIANLTGHSSESFSIESADYLLGTKNNL